MITDSVTDLLSFVSNIRKDDNESLQCSVSESLHEEKVNITF